MVRALMEEQLEEEPHLEVGPLPALILPRLSALISLFAIVGVFLESGKELHKRRSQLLQQHAANAASSSASAGAGAGAIVQQSGGTVRSSTAAHNLTTVHYIQFFYQIPLFCFSLAFALGTLPAPSNLNISGAIGNTATCTVVGAMNQFGILASFGWDAALSLCYLGMARGQSHKGRWIYYHLLIWPIVLVATVIPIPLKVYNFHYSACWMSEYPDECHQEPEEGSCQRGATAPVFMAVTSLCGFVHLIGSIAIMVYLYVWIRKLETRNTTTTGPASSSSSTQFSRPILIQGCLYAFGMVLSLLPTSLNVALFHLTGIWSPAMGVIATTLTPLVGWVNYCVYMRNKRLPQDCHFTYTRLLRRAHSWLLDYDYSNFGHCCCQSIRIYCCSIGTIMRADNKNKKAHPSTTDSSMIAVAASGNNNNKAPDPDTTTTESSIASRLTTTTQSADDDGGDAPEEEEEEAGDEEEPPPPAHDHPPKADAAGSYWIAVQKQQLHIVSDIGESLRSGYYDDECDNAAPPTEPTTAGRESGENNKPPSSSSCTGTTEATTGTESESEQLDREKKKEVCKMDSPPPSKQGKQTESPPGGVITRVEGKKHKNWRGSRRPPVKPERVLSCLETHFEEDDAEGEEEGSRPVSSESQADDDNTVNPKQQQQQSSNHPHPSSKQNQVLDEIEQLHKMAKQFKATTIPEANQGQRSPPPPSHVAVESEFSNISSIYTMPEMYHGRNLYPKIDDII